MLFDCRWSGCHPIICFMVSLWGHWRGPGCMQSRHGHETIIDIPSNIHNAKIRNSSNSHKWQDRQTHWHIHREKMQQWKWPMAHASVGKSLTWGTRNKPWQIHRVWFKPWYLRMFTEVVTCWHTQRGDTIPKLFVLRTTWKLTTSCVLHLKLLYCLWIFYMFLDTKYKNKNDTEIMMVLKNSAHCFICNISDSHLGISSSSF